MNLNKTVLIRNLRDLKSKLKVLQNLLRDHIRRKKRAITRKAEKIKTKQRMWNFIWEVRATQFWKWSQRSCYLIKWWTGTHVWCVWYSQIHEWGCSLQWFQFTRYQKGTKGGKSVNEEHLWAAEGHCHKSLQPEFPSVFCILHPMAGHYSSWNNAGWNNTQGHLTIKKKKAQIKMQVWEKLMSLPLSWIWGMLALLCGRSGIQTAQLLHPQLLSFIYSRVKFLNGFFAFSLRVRWV